MDYEGNVNLRSGDRNCNTIFGVRDNKAIHVKELNQKLDRGLKCKCNCLVCGMPLNAKLGDINEWHFAHTNNCEGTLETALHLFAKEVLEKNKIITIPEVKVFFSESSTKVSDLKYIEGNRYQYKNLVSKLISKSKKIIFERVEVEKVIDDIKPDIVLYSGDKKLLVEVKVTHPIDYYKKEKIIKKDLSTIEIDLSGVDFYNFDKEAVEKEILYGVSNKFWIHNSYAANKLKTILEDNKKVIENKMKVDEEKEKKKKEWISEKDERIKKLLENRDKIEENKFINLEKDILWKRVAAKYKLNKNKMPIFLDIDKFDDIAFKCHRYIWQSMIYDKFINNRKGKSIRCVKVISWITKYKGLPYEYDLKYNDKSNYINLSDLTDVVFGYLKELSELGILRVISDHSEYYSEFEVVLENFNELRNLNTGEIKKLAHRHIEEHKVEEKDIQVHFRALNREGNIQMESHIEKKYIEPRSIGVAVKCEVCGEMKSEWTIFNGATQTCKCKECWDKIPWGV